MKRELMLWMTLCIYLFLLALRVIRMRLPAVLRQKYSLGGENTVILSI